MLTSLITGKFWLCDRFPLSGVQVDCTTVSHSRRGVSSGSAPGTARLMSVWFAFACRSRKSYFTSRCGVLCCADSITQLLALTLCSFQICKYGGCIACARLCILFINTEYIMPCPQDIYRYQKMHKIFHQWRDVVFLFLLPLKCVLQDVNYGPSVDRIKQYPLLCSICLPLFTHTVKFLQTVSGALDYRVLSRLCHDSTEVKPRKEGVCPGCDVCLFKGRFLGIFVWRSHQLALVFTMLPVSKLQRPQVYWKIAQDQGRSTGTDQSRLLDRPMTHDLGLVQVLYLWLFMTIRLRRCCFMNGSLTGCFLLHVECQSSPRSLVFLHKHIMFVAVCAVWVAYANALDTLQWLQLTLH